MKKMLILVGSITLFTTQAAFSQTQAGNFMIGSQLANISGTFQNKSNEFDLNITPGMAYFFHNNIAVGALLNLGFQAPKGVPNTFSYGIGPWVRYYFSTPEGFDFSKHAAFFLDGFAGIQGVTHSKGGGSTNGLGIMAGPGISYFITRNVSVDGSLTYNVVIGFGNATTVNKIGLNLGFQIFLPTRKLQERYREEER